MRYIISYLFSVSLLGLVVSALNTDSFLAILSVGGLYFAILELIPKKDDEG